MLPEDFESRVLFVKEASEDEMLLMPTEQLRNLCKGMQVEEYWKKDKTALVRGMKSYVGQEIQSDLLKELGYTTRYPRDVQVIANTIYNRFLRVMHQPASISKVSQIAGLVIAGERNLVSNSTGEVLKGTALHDRRTDILNHMRAKRDRDFVQGDEGYENMSLYFDILLNTWSGLITERKIQFNQKLDSDYSRGYKDGSKARELVDYHDVIDWSINVLENLDKYPRWQDVCTALAFMTGRRMSEIMGTGVFELTDERPYDDISYLPLKYLNFSGQLKGSRSSQNRDRSFVIPVFAKPELIIAGIERLASIRYSGEDSQIVAAEKVHRSFSGSLTKNMKRLPILGLKFSDSRDIYAAMLSVLVNTTKRLAQDTFYSEIMGHDMSSKKPTATDAYMLLGVSDEWKSKIFAMMKM
jgi:hypothetical protein